jgi:hypothetical protein
MDKLILRRTDLLAKAEEFAGSLGLSKFPALTMKALRNMGLEKLDILSVAAKKDKKFVPKPKESDSVNSSAVRAASTNSYSSGNETSVPHWVRNRRGSPPGEQGKRKKDMSSSVTNTRKDMKSQQQLKAKSGRKVVVVPRRG